LVFGDGGFIICLGLIDGDWLLVGRCGRFSAPVYVGIGSVTVDFVVVVGRGWVRFFCGLWWGWRFFEWFFVRGWVGIFVFGCVCGFGAWGVGRILYLFSKFRMQLCGIGWLRRALAGGKHGLLFFLLICVFLDRFYMV